MVIDSHHISKMSPSCNTCKKTAPEVSLKRCSRCLETNYCSQDCQKADWKAHKQTCGWEDASSVSSSSDSTGGPADGLSPPKGLEKPIANPFSRLDNGTWLHDRPEKDVYRVLIDAYRFRVEDDYTIEGDADEDSIYGGAPHGLRGHKRFLKRASSRSGLLPPWWSAEKQKACERLGMDSSQWHDLRCAVEKSDIIKHYGDPQFPMQLRMLAEAVYRRGPGGQSGKQMRKMMAAMEGAGWEPR